MNEKGVSGTSEPLSYAPPRVLLATVDNEVPERLESASRTCRWPKLDQRVVYHTSCPVGAADDGRSWT